MDDKDNQEYEQVNFPEHNPTPPEPFQVPSQSPIFLSKKQQQQLLLSIKFNIKQNENLLDITCEETNPSTSRNFDYREWREFVEDRVIQIFGPTTIQEGYITSYKLYKIKTKKKDKDEDDWETVVQRRYSDFQFLHLCLIENYGGFLIPRLPEKNMWVSLNMETFDDIKVRKQKLKKYLQKVLSHNKLRYTEQFLMFLFDRQNNFSEKKGQYTNKYSLEDTIKKVTSNAFDTGLSLIKQYMIKSGLIEQRQEYESIDYNSLAIKQRNNKQDQQIMQYQIIVNGLTQTIREIKIIVQNTYQQKIWINGFDSICELFFEETEPVEQSRIKNKGKKSKSSRIDIQQSSKIQQFPELMPPLKYQKYDHLLQSYENLFEFIQSCKQAINRRNHLSKQLIYLRHQQQILIQRNKNNPRNINLDILRSKISNASQKCEQFTLDLLQQLETKIIMSKSMVGQFIHELSGLRAELYGVDGK